MTRIHDMGGRFGESDVEPDFGGEPVFKESWQARALALTLAVGALGKWNIDESRHSRECLPPKEYLEFSYYEKWLAGLVNLLVLKKVITTLDLSNRNQNHNKPVMDPRVLEPGRVTKFLSKGGHSIRSSTVKQTFRIGDEVCTKPAENELVSGGHTRLPAYAAKKSGKIVSVHGCHVFPDANAHGLGECAEPLYSVEFSASELWTHPEASTDSVTLDLWQSYLFLR